MKSQKISKKKNMPVDNILGSNPSCFAKEEQGPYEMKNDTFYQLFIINVASRLEPSKRSWRFKHSGVWKGL